MNSKLSNKYLAGFFDGEGSVYTGRGNKTNYFYLAVSIANTKFRVINQIHKQCGGAIHTTKMKAPANNARQWVLHGFEAIKFLKQILPYCVVKSKVIKIALQWEYFRHGRKNGGTKLPISELKKRLKWYRQMKILNSRGR